jgi:UDP-glucose 4-epimerase
VARQFQAEGHEVTGFDISHIEGESFTAKRGDLLDLDHVIRSVRGHDVICHIGAIGDVYLAAKNPALAAQVNVAGSAHVAIAATQAGAKVVYASTWEVYGSPEYEPVDEEHPCRPDHPYNVTKLAGEQLLMSSGRIEGLQVISLRLGTAYGPGLRPNSVFSIFIDRAMRGLSITIQGDGSQARQFTHASDIARAFLLAAESNISGMVLNTIASEVISIKQLAEYVIARYPTDLSFGEARPGDVATSYVSAAKIKQVLGWEPRVSFQDGLKELLVVSTG